MARVSKAGEEAEFTGDECVVLPKNFLKSPVAVSEIYADELASVATNLNIDEWTSRSFLRGTMTATLLWALPALWTVCW